MNGTTKHEYRPMTVRVACQLATPQTWVASALPALFGVIYSALKGYELGTLRAVGLVLTCILMQSAVNTLNDYFDFIKGTDSKEDNVEESDAALIYSGVAPQSAKHLGIGFLVLAAVLGLSCCAGRGFAPLAVGLFGGAMIVLYSGGPLPVSYLPIGELISGFTMGGLIPLGVVACAAGRLEPGVLAYSLPFILGIALIMMSNNGCDIEKDIRAGRRTLPTLLGRARTLPLYRGLIALWAAVLTALSWRMLGLGGVACVLALTMLGGMPFWKLQKLHLEPVERVFHMKGILAANVFGNGAYLAAAALTLVLHG